MPLPSRNYVIPNHKLLGVLVRLERSKDRLHSQTYEIFDSMSYLVKGTAREWKSILY